MGTAASSFPWGRRQIEYVREEKRVVAKKVDARRSNSLKDFATEWVGFRTYEQQEAAMDGIRKYWKRHDAAIDERRSDAADMVLNKLLRLPAAVQAGDMRKLKEAVALKWRDINRVYAEPPYLGDTLLHIVCREGYLPMLKFMLAPTSKTIFETTTLEANATNRRGRTPLHLCFTPPHFTSQARLAGITLDAATGMARPAAEPPPGLAVKEDWVAPGKEEERQEMVSLLVGEGGADPRTPDYLGYAAVHYAALWGWDTTLRVLVQARGDAAQATAAGETCLHLASAGGHTAAAKAALALSPRLIDRSDVAGRRPIHYAIAAGSEAVVQLLAAAGADVNGPDYDGTSPLKLACEANSAPLVLALLDAGAVAEEECVALLKGDAAEKVRWRLRCDADALRKRQKESQGAELDEQRRKEEAARGQWKPYRDKLSGNIFYYNTVSRQSQWPCPPDYVADTEYLVKAAPFGMHFYH